MKVNKPIFFVILLTLATAGAHAAGWEYIVKTYKLLGDDTYLTKELNQLGAQNWELTGCTPKDSKLICIFKRAK